MDEEIEILATCADMAAADAASAALGVSGAALMEAAGAAVVRSIVARFERQCCTVLCGPGNNGGDGYVVARLLAEAGWPVCVGVLGGQPQTGDAASMAARWHGRCAPATPALVAEATLIVDALFGAGLSRPLEGLAAELVAAMAGRIVVAIDVPSGVAGDTGAVLGAAPQAALTVTFVRRKPAHLLYPGRALCGEIVLADIGMSAAALATAGSKIFANKPPVWRRSFPWPAATGHKYDRGHVLIAGGARMTGAARLAARAAARIGAGLVTVASPTAAIPLYAADFAALIVQPMDRPEDFDALLADARRNCVLVGPGNGADEACRLRAWAALAAGKTCVLDADALTACATLPDALFQRLRADCVLTPHDGEFKRLFPDIVGDRLVRARAAAKRANAVVLLKGADTVVAAPDGRACINENAPPWLATAGSGDVLAGLVAGLSAQAMPSFEAACAAVFLHSTCARTAGPGLIADDLPPLVPRALAALRDAGHLGTANRAI